MNEHELANSITTLANGLELAAKVIENLTPELNIADQSELVSIAETELNNELINRSE